MIIITDVDMISFSQCLVSFSTWLVGWHFDILWVAKLLRECFESIGFWNYGVQLAILNLKQASHTLAPHLEGERARAHRYRRDLSILPFLQLLHNRLVICSPKSLPIFPFPCHDNSAQPLDEGKEQPWTGRVRFSPFLWPPTWTLVSGYLHLQLPASGDHFH